MRLALLLVAIWAFGFVCGLGYVALSGGWYEYRVFATTDWSPELINDQGWEPIPGREDLVVLQRPRFKLP